MQSQASKLESLFVEAGAGAGKTYSLTEHVFTTIQHYYSENKSYPKLVICTFTVKATQELRERLIKKAYEKNQSHFIAAIKDSTYTNITTIHGLLNSILRKYALDFGLIAKFDLQEELDSVRQRKKILRRILLQNPNFQSILEYYQFKKLEDVLYRLFLESLANPNLDFCSEEQENTFRQKILSDLLDNLESVRLQLSAAGLEEQSTIVAKVIDSKNLDKINEIKLPKYSKKIQMDKEDWDKMRTCIKEVHEVSSKACLDGTFWLENRNVLSAFKEIASLYFKDVLKYKLQHSKICLSEIEGITNHLLSQHPDVVSKIKNEIQYWYVDEFQDTSPLQYSILKKLIGETKHFVVGDPQQSIYLFRGAEVGLFQQVKESFVENNLPLKYLETNYRSRPSVLSLINDIFTPLGFKKMMSAVEVGNNDAAEIVFEEKDSCQISKIITNLRQQGVDCSDIAILVKTNDELKKIKTHLIENKIPVLVSSSGTFYDNPFVRDLVHLLLFLANPHNNEVFLNVLRSSLFQLGVDEIRAIYSEAKQARSAWESAALVSTHPAILKIKALLCDLNSKSYFSTLQSFLLEEKFLDKQASLDTSGLSFANSLKLLQLLKEMESSSHSNIIRFCKKALGYYFAEDEADAVSPVSSEHVHLMTVHKSKGLEFKYVILPFLDKGFHYQPNYGLALDSKRGLWSVSLPYGEDFKSAYNAFGYLWMKDDKKRKQDEYLRLFYVAVTRAMNKVFFVGQRAYKNDSWFSYLPAPFLQNPSFEGDFYTVNHRGYEDDIHTEPKPKENSRSTYDLGDLLKPSRRFSVTQILASEKFEGRKLSPQVLLEAEHIGTKTHASLERYRFSQNLMTEDKEIIDYLLSTDVPFGDLLKSGNVEWGFSYKMKNALMEGKVDLWGEVNNVIWIVDYKTGSDRYREKAFQQLQYYSLPIRKYAGLEQAKLVVVYPFSKKIYMQDAKDSAELEIAVLQDLEIWLTRNELLLQSL